MSRTAIRGGRSEHANAALFFEPRMRYILAVVSLVCYGLLMVFSASSITAMYDVNGAKEFTYYFFNQLLFGGIGLVFAVVLACIDYRIWARHLMVPIGCATVLMLLLVYAPAPIGSNVNGASRWINIGSHGMQPSEFAKVSLILIAAQLGEEYQEGRADTLWLVKLAWLVGLPLLMILFEPDKGTVAIIGLTLLVMLWYCGIDTKWIGWFALFAALGLVAFIIKDPYATRRIEAMLNPAADPADAGYQINQGFMAFGSGGLFGVGLGMSRQKYDYLPEMHTDYIYAVIGEELGLVGTLLVLVLFAVLIYSGYQIAQRASDASGQLVASGFATLMGIQLCVNICGVLGLVPASGKPVPFLSYGGSSLIACLMMSGLVVSVSYHSELPATVYEQRRSRLQLYDGPQSGGGDFRVLSGGGFGGPTPSELRSTFDMVEAHGGSITYNANGTQRINLGGNASDRLRGRTSGSGARRR